MVNKHIHVTHSLDCISLPHLGIVQNTNVENVAT